MFLIEFHYRVWGGMRVIQGMFKVRSFEKCDNSDLNKLNFSFMRLTFLVFKIRETSVSIVRDGKLC